MHLVGKVIVCIGFTFRKAPGTDGSVFRFLDRYARLIPRTLLSLRASANARPMRPRSPGGAIPKSKRFVPGTRLMSAFGQISALNSETTSHDRLAGSRRQIRFSSGESSITVSPGRGGDVVIGRMITSPGSIAEPPMA
jgi:hypothetical protein